MGNSRLHRDVFLILVPTLWLCTLAVGPAEGHPISFSKAKADVDRQRLVLHVSVLCEDFFLYYGLEADDRNMLQAESIAAAAESHKEFLLRHLSVLDKQGDKLSGKIVRTFPFTMPEDGVSVDAMSSSRYATNYILEYDLRAPPEFLTFSQNFGGDASFIPSIMELTVCREGVEIDYVAQLGRGQAHIMRFDWTRPPAPLTAEERLARNKQRSDRQAAMGISSYVSIYSFIYIERFQIRHEILIPLLTLESFLQIKRANGNFLGIDEQDAAKEKIAELFTLRNPVSIDGVTVKGVVSRIDFYGLDFKDFALRAPRKRLSAINARVGVIITYSTKGYPGGLEMTWELFSRSSPVLRSTVFTDNETAEFVFSRFRRTYRWSNPGMAKLPPLNSVPAPPPVAPLSLPLLSLLLLAASLLFAVMLFRNRSKRIYAVAVPGLLVTAWLCRDGFRLELDNPLRADYEMEKKDADAVFATLHKNIYRAFDYRAEGDVYDALSGSVGGELLPELYLVINRGRRMAEQGGAVSRINEIEILHGRLLKAFYGERGNISFTYLAGWNVSGTVEHWGHIHERTHQYEAEFELQALKERWRITGFKVRDEKRLAYRTRLRRF